MAVLAESWEADSDARVWRFRLRPGMLWENGEPIAGAEILASWRRASLALSRRGMKDGLFSRLAGPSGGLPGARLDGRVLALRFERPFPKLLDVLGLPLYAVVHPTCYDAVSGAWLCHRRTVSSGPYRISHWGRHSFRLALRGDVPKTLRHAAAPEEFVFVPAAPRGSADLALGASLEAAFSESMRFSGGMESTISYLRCQSWSHPSSTFHSPEIRRVLRASFYREFRGLGGIPRLSFFPPAVVGVRESSEPPEDSPGSRPAKGGRLSFRSSWSFTRRYQDAVERMAAREGLKFEALFIPKADMRKELAPGLARYRNDLVVAMVSMGSDDPSGAVRDMFLGLDGILLPDPTGRIRRELVRAEVDLQRVNEILWDDAIVWPVEHFGMGWWLKPGLDPSQVNFDAIPPALEWLGRSD